MFIGEIESIIYFTSIIAAGLFGGLITLVIYKWFRIRVYVKRINNINDTDIDAFLELYESLFDENVRLSSDEILSWIEEDVNNRSRKDYLLICKIGQQVGGFLKSIYYSDSKLLFIAYYGIDKSIPRARLFASTALLNALFKIVRKEIKNCKAVVFEIEVPDDSLPSAENLKRRARSRLLKEVAKMRKFNLYHIKIDYLQPYMPTEPGEISEEERLLLLCLPINEKIKNSRLSKARVMDILYFIYMQIYGPTYRHDPIKNQAYHFYLSNLLKKYEESLPEYIPLEK